MPGVVAEVLAYGDPAISEADLREELRLLLEHSCLKRSIRLCRFLTFVVEQTLKDEGVSLTEQQIGIALFGRKPSYDTGSDNIVRVYASELRKRLEAYYAGEGSGRPLRIEIPRGSYRPMFQRQGLQPLQPTERATPEVDNAAGAVPLAAPSLPAGSKVTQAPSKSFTLTLVLFVVAAVLLAVQSFRVHALQRQLQPWRAAAATRSLWSSFFQGEQPTTVVLADTSFAMAQDLTGYRLTLSDYLNQSYLQQLSQPTNGPVNDRLLHTMLSLISNRNTGSVSDFRTARRILDLDLTSSRAQVQFARDFSAQALRHGSTVLIGSARSDPWVGIFQKHLFFQLESPANSSTILVRLIRPRPGEQSVYATSSDPNRTDGFCVIALLPNPSGEGKTLIIAGTDSQATEAGGDFVTQEESLATLERRLKAPLDAPFQLLLRTSRAAGSPVGTEIVAERQGSL